MIQEDEKAQQEAARRQARRAQLLHATVATDDTQAREAELAPGRVQLQEADAVIRQLKAEVDGLQQTQREMRRSEDAGDLELQCQDCGVRFFFTAHAQVVHAVQGLREPPTRCPPCRNEVYQRERNQAPRSR